MQLSVNFTSEEFACNCGCGFDDIQQAIVDKLQNMRYELKVPIRINSGCRCAKHNKDVGGAPSSFHVLGRAADISSPGVSLATIYEVAKSVGFHGLGLGNNFLHVDNRDDFLTWHYDANNRPVYV